MAGLKPPGPLSFQGNVATNWKDWLLSYELYETATELQKKGDDVRYATFLHVVGATAQRIAKTFELTSEESGKVDTLKKKFAAYTVSQGKTCRSSGTCLIRETNEPMKVLARTSRT